MGMTVYFLRHGQTAWNAEMRMQGQVNVPLNDEGRRQARGAAACLPAIALCLTSPLDRARETARLALGGEGTPMLDEPLLIEQGYAVHFRICLPFRGHFFQGPRAYCALQALFRP